MRLLSLLLLTACSGGGELPSQDGAQRPILQAFPSAHLVDAGGHLDLGLATWPQSAGGTPFDPQRHAWRTGFSPVQTTVVDLGIALDPDSLPAWDADPEQGSVQLWDLDAGMGLLRLAELDASGDEDEVPVLLVRPLEPVPAGHRVGVFLTDELRTAEGEAVERVAWLEDLLAGAPHPELADWEGHYTDLIEAFTGPGEVVMLTDFPTQDPTAPTRHIVDSVQIPASWSWENVQDTNDGGKLPEGVWKRLAGTLEVDTWLVDDGAFELDDQGLPIAQGTATEDLWVYLPDSLQDAEPGTAPVWVFGHGIFAEPDYYFTDDDDASGVIDLAERAGAVVVGIEWRGLTADDRLVAIDVGSDFHTFPHLTDKLAQALANQASLVRLLTEGGLLDDPLLEGKADKSQLRYYGISLGGIEGAALFGLTDAFGAGVFHVGGASWSTMLERSSHWTLFEPLVKTGVPSARDRQLLYAMSQLLWDPADPACYAADLQDQPVLWQESIGDEQVANLTTEVLARGVGATLLEPSVTAPTGLSGAAAPLQGPALSQFDPQTETVHQTNRPAPKTGAHEAPRTWEGAKLQTLRFLDLDDPGVVEHFCGDAPCATDNTGDQP